MDGFGENLRRRARELGLSDSEVARRVGLSANRYSNYVRNEREPDLATLRKLADVLGISLDSLLNSDKTTKESDRDPSIEAIIVDLGILNPLGIDVAASIVRSLTAKEKLRS
ncbi:MAG: helix-turn-helix transcriptional regulator [Azospirillaceae bacterium]